MPAGTTIITHGLSLTSQFGSDSWVRAMGNAIAGRSPGSDVFLMYDFAAGVLKYDGGAAVPATFQAGTGSEEYIVYVSWESASSRTTPGWAESAAEGLYGTLRRYGLADANHPLHFIGHSYGTVVNSEVIQRLGYLDGLTVDQLTTLDPHDFYEVFTGSLTPTYEINVKQPDVHVWSNVTYADNYYNTAGTSSLFSPLPHGRALDGAMTQAAVNVNLSSLAGFNVSGSLPHSRVHEYYALTIDPAINLFDPSLDHSTWFAGSSTNYGYRYSRIGGTAADRAAYFAGYTQRTNPASPPDNSALDVGKDPPGRIYNGDFFNTVSGSGLLAGYTGSPQITGAPANPAALLNSAGKTLTHLPVYFPPHTKEFAFDYTVAGPPAGDALSVTFQRDDGQSFTFTDPGILNAPGSGTRTLDFSSFPNLSQLLGRMASITLTLNTTQSATSLAVDNLRIASPNVLPPAVTVNDGSAQRSRVTSLQLGFNQNVTLPVNPADAFQLRRQSDNALVALNAVVTGNVVSLTFAAGPVAAGSLADGRYTLTLRASQINGGAFDGNSDGIPGDDYVLTGTPTNGLFRLFGDSDGNGTVNSVDFLAFRLAFLGSSAPFDSDGNGTVDSGDFLQFRLRFLLSV
ncbi:MAG: hypothetical protein K1X57_07875 [Gemmataceae bacterium]|nr:hypothetical protein [Gemmataceae bacterium]